MYEREQFVLIYHQALSMESASVQTLFSVRPVRSRTVFEAWTAIFAMGEIRSACFFHVRRGREIVFDSTRVLYNWLLVPLGQDRAMEERHAVPKPEGRATFQKQRMKTEKCYCNGSPAGQTE